MSSSSEKKRGRTVADKAGHLVRFTVSIQTAENERADGFLPLEKFAMRSIVVDFLHSTQRKTGFRFFSNFSQRVFFENRCRTSVEPHAVFGVSVRHAHS